MARNLEVEDIGLGMENTVTREYLCAITGLSDSQMRIQMQHLKEKGVIICSSCNRKGYFRPILSRPQEREIAMRDYAERERKARSLFVQLKYLKKALTGNSQLELF